MKGNERWNLGTIRGVVTNPAYKGEGQFGRRRSAPTERSRRRIRWITDPGQLIPLKYPPIVTPELWAEANAVESKLHPVRSGVDRYLLRGDVVLCGEHNLVMGGSKNEYGSLGYRCKRPTPDGHMCTHGIPSRTLDEAVWSDVMAFLADP